MGFVMDGLDAEAYDRQYSDRQLVRRILAYFLPQTRRILLVAAAITAAALLDVALPIYISRSLDQLAGNPSLDQLLRVGGIIMLLGALSWVFNYVRRSVSARRLSRLNAGSNAA